MWNTKRLTYLGLGIVLAFGGLNSSTTSAAEPDDAGGLITVGVRKPGAGGHDGLPEMDPVKKIDIDKLPMRTMSSFDAQYGKKKRFKGVPLEALIARVKAPTFVDLALLHFSNGMVVPLAFRDKTVMKRLRPVIARGEFDPVTDRIREYVDVPVINFRGNKIVVQDRWHPDVPARAAKDLSPWEHVDSLVGIELVNAGAYNQMFNVDKKSTEGFAIFRQSCQFCHGVRNVGAKFGWDFVDPMPVHEWRTPPQRLYWHVKLRPYNAVERGEKMPALKYMTEKDGRAAFQWLQSAAQRPLKKYQPPEPDSKKN